jgi:hypothetical protein
MCVQRYACICLAAYLTYMHSYYVQVVWPDQSLGETLKLFKQGKGHIAVVRDVDNSGPVSTHTHMYTATPITINHLNNSTTVQHRLFHRC